MISRTLFKVDPVFTNRGTNSVTFRGKLSLPIHRWYRLTASFSPHLAWDIADHFDLSEKDFVLDPFSGVGTVPLCMKHKAIPACSVEINPFLHFVGRVKTRDYDDLAGIEATFSRFIVCYKRQLQDLPANPREYLSRHDRDVPRISKPERWWSPANLMQLVALRRLVEGFNAPTHHRDLLRMGILGILVPVSNAKHNHVSLTFALRPLAPVDMGSVIEAKLNEMLGDLRSVSNSSTSRVEIHFGNSKDLSTVLAAGPRPTAVITSPPYPNRFSYARETRPHLFFFDFIADAKAVSELETDAIGGTWGKATSELSAGIDPLNEVVEQALARHLNIQANDRDGLMRSYVIKYFNNMYEHGSQLAAACAKRVKLAYVIGNSRFYGEPLPSDEILAAIFRSFGFNLLRIDRMRKRQSKSGLYEAIVFMER